MKRQVQTVEKMQEQLQEDKKSYTKLYKAQADAYKEDAIADQIQNKLALLETMQARGKVDLYSLGEVQIATTQYLRACQGAGAFPTLAGLATSMGYSRQYVYKWLSTNSRTPTADYLEVARSAFADILTQAGLKKNCDTILSIFLLKNSGQGLSDRQELAVEPVVEKAEPTAEEIARKYADIFPDDEVQDYS